MDNAFGFFMLFLVIAINVAISTWNAWIVGKVWDLAEGFGATILLICGLIQSVVGYSSAFMVGLGFGAYGLGYLDEEYLHLSMQLWYLGVIFPALGSGMVIWLHSVLHAIRNPSFGSIGIAGWNTFAQAHNMYHALDQVPQAYEGVGKLLGEVFGGKSKMDGRAIIAILIAIAALGLGMLATGIVFVIGRQSTLAELAGPRAEERAARKLARR